ncbi:GNAT family N-acetyltransferase [Streptomyces sp. NPDC015220]|uniref:GNAT family N-acetyltransferase n=1 Tax=Streptomyces sp. NPDC015220 TaxID=3364947 RepID=UPI0036F5D4EE
MTRPATDADLDAVNAMHARSSRQSRHSRYQGARREISPTEWAALIRPGRGLGWVTHPVGDPELVVAATHLVRARTGHAGELGILVEDAWQDAGLGSGLVRHALGEARSLGLRVVTVMTDRANRRMLSICRALGARTLNVDGATLDLALPVPGRPCTPPHGVRGRDAGRGDGLRRPA